MPSDYIETSRPLGPICRDTDGDDCPRSADWMAQELVRVSRAGHRDTQTALRELGDRWDHGVDRLSADLRTYMRLVVLALGLTAAIAGVRLILFDGTVIEPAAGSEAEAP